MRILQVNQYYYPRGGADKYFLDLSQSLIDSGHEVAVFSMDHPKNLATPWSKYFVSRISFNQPDFLDKLKTPGRVLYSLEAKRKFSKLVDDFKPEIIHIHNIYHHISPSILTVARQKKIAVVMHLHDYKLVCPNHALFTKGAYCERCRPHKYYECARNCCVKNSFAGSTLAALEMYLHHSWLHIYENNVDLFVAPSVFMKDTVIRFGQNAKKIKVIYNPYNSKLIKNNSEVNYSVNHDDYLLYFGRLSAEKGLDVLIQASAAARQRIIITGEGPEEGALKHLAIKLKAPVEFVGYKYSPELRTLIQNAKAVVIPSIWGENMSLSLLESISLGKIVIAARIGGIPEVIDHGRNGLLFEPGNAEDLVRKIKELSDIDQVSMSQAAKQSAAIFSPQLNLSKILDAYRQLLNK